MFSTSAGYCSMLPFSNTSSSPRGRGHSFASFTCFNRLLPNHHVGGISVRSKRGYRLQKPHSNLRVFCLQDRKGKSFFLSGMFILSNQ